MPKHVLMMDPADSLTTEDILYLIQGSGLDCDRKVSLAEVRAFVVAAANIINTQNIVNNAITNEKMADNSVGAAEIINGSITAQEIADRSITAIKIADWSLSHSEMSEEAWWNRAGLDAPDTKLFSHQTSQAGGELVLRDAVIFLRNMAANSVGNAQLVNSSVGSNKIQGGAVNVAHIADKAIRAFHIEDGAVSTPALAAFSVTSDKLADTALMGRGDDSGSYLFNLFERISGQLILKNGAIKSWMIADEGVGYVNLDANLKNRMLYASEILQLSLSHQHTDSNPTNGETFLSILGAPLAKDSDLWVDPTFTLLGGNTFQCWFRMTFQNTTAAITARLRISVSTSGKMDSVTNTYYSDNFTIPVAEVAGTIHQQLTISTGGTIGAGSAVWAEIQFMSTVTTTFKAYNATMKLLLR